MDLIEVYAAVTDAKGEPVSGLAAEDFEVAEDDVPQRVAAFAAGDFPLAVAIGLDRSFSLSRERLRDAVAALSGFVGALRPEDQAMVMAIGSETEVVAPLSSAHASSVAALERIERWGTTPLYDSIVAAVDAIEPVKGRRALILLSDGADRYSRTSAAQVVEHVRRRDVLVYPITLGKARPEIFVELASLSGGRSFQAADQRALREALSTIGRELRSQYLLGYSPSRPAGGQSSWRSIRVSVKRPNLRVRARDGYFAR